MTPKGTITATFDPIYYIDNVIPTPVNPTDLTAGPDGNLWFTDSSNNLIWRMSPTGTFTDFPVPTASSVVGQITSGPDGNLWFTEQNVNQIGRITPSGSVTDFALPGHPGTTLTDTPMGITAGPDGNIWFTQSTYKGYQILQSLVGRITPGGSVSEFAVTNDLIDTYGVTAGSDGNIWFTLEQGIGRITPSETITEFALAGGADSITNGQDGGLWFTDNGSNPVGRITTSGSISEFTLPRTSGAGSITVGPDANIWFTSGVNDQGAIGRLNLNVLFGVATNHSLWGFTVAKTSNQLLDAGVQFVSAAPGDVAFVVNQDGSLSQQTSTGFSPLASAGLVESVSAGDDGSGQPLVNAVGTDHSLWKHDTTGWHQLAGPGLARTVSAGPHGVVFAVGIDQSLWEHDATGWNRLTGPGLALSISGGSDSAGQPVVDVIGTDHSLWQNDNSVWHRLVNPGLVKAISAGPADTVFAEGMDNSLWVFDSGWAKLGPGGPPAGAVLGLIGASDSNGAPAVFVIGNDQSVWEDTVSGWIEWSPAGTAMGIGVAP